MARPWKKEWPRIGKRSKSWVVGFYDHERTERSRSFRAASGTGGAREWMANYSAAERRGPDSLRRFLLDLDAKEANQEEGRTIGEVVELYFALDADPKLEGGLAPSTFMGYRNVANCHLLGHVMRDCKQKPIGRARYAVELAARPAREFNEPHAPRKWREEMRAAKLPKQRIQHAWRVLSSVLSWAASSHHISEISTNGCILANERSSSRRRSARRGGTGVAASQRRTGSQVPNWALSPLAVEAIRVELLARCEGRELFAERDAAMVSLQYGLGSRSQEMYGIRWSSIGQEFVEIMEVISFGTLDEWGKTMSSTNRRSAYPPIMLEDLNRWRRVLRTSGHPARDVDFIFPGDLGGAHLGVLDKKTGAVHFTRNMTRQWGPRNFRPAVTKAAKRPGMGDIAGATPYSLRRGGISVRLRAEDPQTVASECGTSLQMLDAHYAFAIDDLRRFGPRPVEVEWRAARAQIQGTDEGPHLWLAA